MAPGWHVIISLTPHCHRRDPRRWDGVVGWNQDSFRARLLWDPYNTRHLSGSWDTLHKMQIAPAWRHEMSMCRARLPRLGPD